MKYEVKFTSQFKKDLKKAKKPKRNAKILRRCRNGNGIS